MICCAAMISHQGLIRIFPRGTGYDVLLWIEQAIVDTGFQPPKINVHTSNPAARIRMLAAVEQITRLAEMKSQ